MIHLPPELLRAICDRPHDDTLRLIAADWWEEAGECDRAEFVRVQCELADLERLGVHAGRSCNITGACAECGREVQHERLCRRERELLLNGRDYAWFYPRGLLVGKCEWIYRRGFVEEIHCTLTDWAGLECQEGTGTGRLGGYGPAIVACQPVTRLVLTDLEPEFVPRDPGFAPWQIPSPYAGNYWANSEDEAARESGKMWLQWARQQVGLPPLEYPQ